ncbi:Paraneoplastic antigen Ma1-like protein [Larimichthys crocea]|uniref:Paraneoplastic antigen Ma1-like protein n=1 Tax=Larimichthys crocea TaxID=215358 RepID=A0A6G0HLR8_LARCR|nr:Paraneoplastic antigen Ma1-like protein [Larimichthys crocea]
MANSDDKLFVCVSGVTSSDADQDIIDSLKKYGPVAGIRRVQNTGGSDGETVVVEFQSGTTRANVEPLLPMEVANVTNPSVKRKVDHVPTLTSSADQAAAVPSASSTDSSSDSDNGARSDNSTTPLVRKSKKRSKHVDMQRRKILESLLPPASDVVRQLGTSAHPRQYVQLLDSAYGLVEDGEEVFARFLNTNQNPGEKASDYLQRLQSLLCTAVKRGGAKQVNADRHLLKQFKRGCWDHSLVLQLELKNEIPPNFAELLLQVRTEEDRRASKHDRMQRHFGSSKTKPSVNIHSVPDISLSDSNASLLQSYISETKSLRKQVAQLQMQLSSKNHKKDKKQEFKGTVPINNSPPPVAEAQAHHVMPQNTPTPRPQPKAWFCYKCGEDGHIARNCDKPMNKALVDQKYTELRHKQDEWKARQPLNWNGFQ